MMTNDRLDMEDPNWRSESQLKDIRSFKVAACRMLEREDRLVRYPDFLSLLATRQLQLDLHKQGEHEAKLSKNAHTRLWKRDKASSHGVA